MLSDFMEMGEADKNADENAQLHMPASDEYRKNLKLFKTTHLISDMG
jgi:hypothetical protein